MAGRNVILCLLCALVGSAIAAQGAMGATNGTTAFTCADVSPSPGTKGFSDSECKNETSTNAEFEHEGFAADTFISPGAGLTRLHSVISGVEVEFQSTNLHGFGWMENMQSGSGEHTVDGTGVGYFTSVSVTKPAGKGCIVTGGEVKTKELKATTAGQGMGLKFEPASGTLLAEFNVTGCSIAALNGKYEVKGSVIGTPEGTGVVFNRAGTTAQGNLKVRGQTAGFDGTVRFSGALPLAATTVETP